MASIAEKITTREELASKVKAWREEGKIVGFTSGAFDIVHAGHVDYLEKAKEKCDILIVGVNTDESVRAYKGQTRPIVPEDERLQTIAGLASVDYVFLFSERRNRANIEALKPSLYIKAGDYTPDELTSADTVSQFGGKTVIIPLTKQVSTTTIIKKMTKVDAGPGADNDVRQASTESRQQQKAVIVDRDGTINVDIEYLHEPEKLVLLPNAGEGLQKFQTLGYKIVVISLQSGIGLGYFTKEDFFETNRAMFRQLEPYKVIIDKIYFATNSKTVDGANPKKALIERARDELDLDLAQCIAIGDKTSDLAPAAALGAKTIGVKTGKALQDSAEDVAPNYMAQDLLDAASWVEQQT